MHVRQDRDRARLVGAAERIDVREVRRRILARSAAPHGGWRPCRPQARASTAPRARRRRSRRREAPRARSPCASSSSFCRDGRIGGCSRAVPRPVRAGADRTGRAGERTTAWMPYAAPVLALPRPTPRLSCVAPAELAHLSDEALVALVARGDETALAELYDRVGRSRTASPTASSATSGSPKTRFKRASSPRGARPRTSRAERAKASTWLLTLVHRRAVDLVRREERRRVEPLDRRPHAASDEPRQRRGGRLGSVRPRARPAGAPIAPGRAARGDRARLLRGLYAVGAGRTARPAAGTIKSRMFSGLARLRELLDDGATEGSWRTEFTS